MLKVMIVDDEILARVGVKSLVPWGDNGFEIIAECDNGKIAFDTAMMLNPDIIITDIKMPIMNGIELLSALKNEKPWVKFLMLSSYEDFDLVRTAMKAGAEDYILKLQMEAQELLEVLLRIRDEIEEERDLRERKDSVELQIQKDLQVLKERFIKDLLYGKKYSNEEIEESLSLYNIDLPTRNLMSLVLLVEEESHSISNRDNVFRTSVSGIISEGIRNYGTGSLVFCEPDMYSILCSLNPFDSEFSLDKAVERMTKSIRDFIKNSLNASMYIGVSNVYDEYAHIGKAYQEAVEALSRRFSYSQGSIIRYRDIENKSEYNITLRLDREMNELSLALKSGNIYAIESAFESLKLNLQGATSLSEKYLIGNCHILIYIINEFIHSSKLKAEDIWGEQVNDYFQFSKLKIVDEYILWLEKIQKAVLAVLKQEQESSTIILRGKQYIHQNISSNITLTAIADYLDLSPSYFSRLFRKSGNKGFIDYVTEEKMKMAKELIRSSNKKIYEVAEAVGYDNVHYFSRVFKKTCGMTPMEYKSGKSKDNAP